MTCARRVVQEERLVRCDRLGVADEFDGLVGQVLGEVITLFGRLRLVHHVVVVDQIGIPLVRLSAQEAVPALETAADGQFRRVEAKFISSSGHRCHLPTMYVFQPASPRISAIVPFSGGWCRSRSEPDRRLVMHAMLLRV